MNIPRPQWMGKKRSSYDIQEPILLLKPGQIVVVNIKAELHGRYLAYAFRIATQCYQKKLEMRKPAGCLSEAYWILMRCVTRDCPQKCFVMVVNIINRLTK